MRTVFLALLAGAAVALSAPVAAQEKKVEKKKTAVKKQPAGKKQAASQDWSRFNEKSKGDLEALEKQKKAGK